MRLLTQTAPVHSLRRVGGGTGREGRLRRRLHGLPEKRKSWVDKGGRGPGVYWEGEGGGPVRAQGDMSGRLRGNPHREILTLAYYPFSVTRIQQEGKARKDK